METKLSVLRNYWLEVIAPFVASMASSINSGHPLDYSILLNIFCFSWQSIRGRDTNKNLACRKHRLQNQSTNHTQSEWRRSLLVRLKTYPNEKRDTYLDLAVKYEIALW